MYERLLGGTIKMMLAYGDSPMAENSRTRWRRRIVHASLEWNGHTSLGETFSLTTTNDPVGSSIALKRRHVV